jgi:hypothetical protein
VLRLTHMPMRACLQAVEMLRDEAQPNGNINWVASMPSALAPRITSFPPQLRLCGGTIGQFECGCPRSRLMSKLCTGGQGWSSIARWGDPT